MPAKCVQRSGLTLGNIGTAEAKVDPCGTSFERRGRVIESSGAAAEYAHALSREPAEIYVVGRIGIKFRGQVGDEVLTCPPASAAFHTGREDDLSRIDAFDPAFPTQMSEEKIAGRLNRSDFDLVFDLKLRERRGTNRDILAIPPGESV